MNLEEFRFPVTERAVAVNDGLNSFSDWENPDTFLSGAYKAIVREDSNELVSIVRQSYQIIPNKVLIDSLMSKLDDLDTPYIIDPSHSFVTNERMRLQVTFPELTMHDQSSEIALSLFVHNSYDMSEGVRMLWGAIRAICSNGMVWGNVLGKYYHRHTQGFRLDELPYRLTKTWDKIPAIEARILELESLPVTTEITTKVQKHLGVKVAKQVLHIPSQSQWQLYNAITHIISHTMAQRLRARYQIATSKVFEL